MAIITLARQVGSGGQSIASALAEQLGYRQYGRRELRQIALDRGLALPESFARFANEDAFQAADHDRFAHLHVSYGELEFDTALRGAAPSPAADAEPSFLDGLTRHRRDILLSLLTVIYQLAADDNVILVGAGSQLLLAEMPGVVSLKIVARPKTRINRLASAYGLPSREARDAVRHADREQREYNRAVLGVDWDDPLMWDLVANTELLTVDQVSFLVCSLIEHPPLAGAVTPACQQILAAAAAINRQFWSNTNLRHSSLVAIPTADGIALRGQSLDDRLHQHAIALASATAPALPIRDDTFTPGSQRLAPRNALDIDKSHS